MKIVVLTKGLKEKHRKLICDTAKKLMPKCVSQSQISSYEAAGILKDLFESRREDFTGHRFITNEGTDYPF